MHGKGTQRNVCMALNEMQFVRHSLYVVLLCVVCIACLYLEGVAPFPGATTGTGGRIRDVQATGRGAHVIAGTAGYCFGNLHIPSNPLSLTFLQADMSPHSTVV